MLDDRKRCAYPSCAAATEGQGANGWRWFTRRQPTKHPAVVALLAAVSDFLALDQPELDPDSPGAMVDEAMVAEVTERLGAVIAAAEAGEISGTELDEVNALTPAVEEKLEDWTEIKKDLIARINAILRRRRRGNGEAL
jgi:hypothetical protein